MNITAVAARSRVGDGNYVKARCSAPHGSLEELRAAIGLLRWCAAGIIEAAKQFRRVNGQVHLPALRAALERDVADGSCAGCYERQAA